MNQWPDGLSPISAISSDHLPTREYLTRCCKTLIPTVDDLSLHDAKMGNGDTGSTLTGAFGALITAPDDLPLASHAELSPTIGERDPNTTNDPEAGAMACRALRDPGPLP